MIYKLNILLIIFLFFSLSINSRVLAENSNKSAIKLARVKYNGGGDWYNDPSAEPNLLKYVAEQTNINVSPVYEYVDLASDNLFLYPLIFLTGHGNINFTKEEAKRLRVYLENGGFLYIDDDYGLDKYVRKEMKKVFPGKKFVELPFNHEIYHCHFDFPNGLPKIHKHNGKAPRGYGIFVDGRLCVYYTYETNISDGWVDPDVHHDSEKIRDLAFKMGTNIIVYALTH